MEEEGSRVPAIPNDEHGLPAFGEARGVHGRMCSRDLGVRCSTGGKPAEHLDRVLPPEAPAKRGNRIGDRTLVE
jgi:hypothetical protein